MKGQLISRPFENILHTHFKTLICFMLQNCVAIAYKIKKKVLYVSFELVCLRHGK